MAEKTTVILQVVTIVLHVITVGFLVIVASLSGDAYFRGNKLRGHTECFLYVSASHINPSNGPCIFSIFGEALAGGGFLLVIGIILVRISSNIKYETNIRLKLWITEFTLLLKCAVVVVAGAIILCSGWGVTCNTLKDINNDYTLDVYRQVTTSTVFACFAVLTTVSSFICTIILAYKDYNN